MAPMDTHKTPHDTPQCCKLCCVHLFCYFLFTATPISPSLHEGQKGGEGERRDDGHTVATDRIRSPCRATQFFYRAILFPRLAAQVKILNSFIYFLLVLFFASSRLCFPTSPSPFLCLMHQPQRGYDRVISPVLPLSGCSFPSMDFGRVFCSSLHYFQTKMRSLCVCMCFCCLRQGIINDKHHRAGPYVWRISDVVFFATHETRIATQLRCTAH